MGFGKAHPQEPHKCSKPALLIWFLASGGLWIAVIITKKRKKPPQTPPPPEQFVTMALAVPPLPPRLFVFSQILYKAYTVPELHKILEWDGIIALCIGALFGIYLACKEIKKLFDNG